MPRTVSVPGRLVLVLAAVLAACGGEPSDPRTPSDSNAPEASGVFLRLATWNVHDLFDEQDRAVQPGVEDEVPTHAEVEAKLQALGRVLSRLDADVLVLQEVENVALLDRLATGPLAGQGYRSFLREGNDPRGIDVGVLSRIAFVPGPSHLDERGPDGRRLWSRDLLEIDLAVAPRPVVVLGAHLVSRLDPSEDGRRLLQATRIRELADRLRADPGHPCVIIAGDLNDLPTASALAPLLRDGAYLDVGSAIPAATAWTWSGEGLRERMDYALIGREDGAFVTRAVVEAGADVAAASDHRPLAVDVWLPAAAR